MHPLSMTKPINGEKASRWAAFARNGFYSIDRSRATASFKQWAGQYTTSELDQGA